jgi:hypothetical protein
VVEKETSTDLRQPTRAKATAATYNKHFNDFILKDLIISLFYPTQKYNKKYYPDMKKVRQTMTHLPII